MMDKIEELCHMTLFPERYPSEMSEFRITYSKAGLRLMEQGSHAVPIIERMITDVVDPIYDKFYHNKNKADIGKNFTDSPPVSNVSYICSAYVNTIGLSQVQRASQFITSSSYCIKYKFVRSFFVCFNKTNPLCDFKIPADYLSLLNLFEQTEQSLLNELAMKARAELS